MPAGDGQATAVADGFNNIIIDYSLTAGTTTRITAQMQPLFTGEMNVGPEATPSSQPVNN